MCVLSNGLCTGYLCVLCVMGIVVICVLMCLLLMPDCWLDVSVRKVLRPAISTAGFSFSVSLCLLKQIAEMVPKHSKLPLHASHVSLPMES